MWIVTLATGFWGFLLGIFSGVLSNPDYVNFPDVLLAMFDVRNRPLNWLNWLLLALSIVCTLAALALPRIVRSWRRKQSYESVLIPILQRLKHESVLKFNVIAVDKAVTLQKCPEIEKGWLASEVNVNHKKINFQLPADLKNAYKDYYEKRFKKEFGEDGTTVMLLENPRAFTDQPMLVLNTEESYYSYALFYWHCVAFDIERRNKMFDSLFSKGKVLFPHNLCLHLVVVTADDKILFTLRSEKVRVNANTWSCSIEEMLRPEDLKGKHALAINRWAKRALFEELGLCSNGYTDDNIRILSVFLEADRPNISLVGLVTLGLNQRELSEIIATLPRNDYEFTDVTFLSFQEMAEQLLRPTRSYHPTSRYRMLMTLLHRLGEPNFALEFVKLFNSK